MNKSPRQHTALIFAVLATALSPWVPVKAQAVTPTPAAMSAATAEAAPVDAPATAATESTGAESHARKLAMAIITGTARRAYLKGLGQAEGCSPPAARLLLPAVTPAS
jgi:hypothetical protein